MSFLFGSWATDNDEEEKEEEAEESENDPDETTTDVVKATDEISEAPIEEKKEIDEVKPKPAEPAFFCKWVTDDDNVESDEDDNDSNEDAEDEAVGETEDVEPKNEEDINADNNEEAEITEKEEVQPTKEEPIVFCKWADDEDDVAFESSEEEIEIEEAKLEPESEEDEKSLEDLPPPDDDGGWMVRMVEDAEDDLLNLPLAQEDTAEEKETDPFDAVYSLARPICRLSKNAAKESEDDNFVSMDNDEADWDTFVADTIEGKEEKKEEKKARKPRKSAKAKASEAPKPGPASRRTRRTANIQPPEATEPAEDPVAITIKEDTKKPVEKKVDPVDEIEDVPLARRRRKRKGTDTESTTRKTKKSKSDSGEMSASGDNTAAQLITRRSSQDKEVGWPRLSSLFTDGGGEEGRRIRKPTAKVQPFVHIEPEKEKRKGKQRERKPHATTKRIHQPAKGPYYAACKTGSYRCPLCFTEWTLNQPYGRHIIGQACQVDVPVPVKKRKGTDEEDVRQLRFISVNPATARTDSTIILGKVPSLKFLSRSALHPNLPSLPAVKEGLEYYHSLYSPYNRSVQNTLFTYLKRRAGLNLVAGLTGYEKLCREPLKIAIYLERKISLARNKLGSKHSRTVGWLEKYSLLLGLPLHDIFLVAASPYRVLEFPKQEEDGSGGVGLLCLTCPKLSCGGCPKTHKAPERPERKVPTAPKKKPKITIKIKKELIEKPHKKEKKDKREKKKDKKKKKDKSSLPSSGLVMTCSYCSTVFNSVTGLGEHRRICKAK